MYFIIPLTIAVSSLLVVFYVVWRKFPYLKKLSEPAVASPSSGEAGLPVFLSEFFPEIIRYVEKIDFDFHKNNLLKEFEKFLRRLRVISLKLDSFTNSLLAKIKVEVLKNEERPVGEFKELSVTKSIKRENPAEKYKKEEQLLIIEIARNPKNPELYKKLADLYILAENFLDAVEALETAVKLDPEDKKTAAKLRAVQKALPSK